MNEVNKICTEVPLFLVTRSAYLALTNPRPVDKNDTALTNPDQLIRMTEFPLTKIHKLYNGVASSSEIFQQTNRPTHKDSVSTQRTRP